MRKLMLFWFIVSCLILFLWGLQLNKVNEQRKIHYSRIMQQNLGSRISVSMRDWSQEDFHNVYQPLLIGFVIGCIIPLGLIFFLNRKSPNP